MVQPFHLSLYIDYNIFAGLFLIAVLLGLILLTGHTIWNYKVLHSYDLEDRLPKRPEKCRHSFVDRRPLTGDRDFETLRSAKCFGNKHVIPSRDGNGGSHCMACRTNFCHNRGCICKGW
jgi:hypothetical protein